MKYYEWAINAFILHFPHCIKNFSASFISYPIWRLRKLSPVPKSAKGLSQNELPGLYLGTQRENETGDQTIVAN